MKNTDQVLPLARKDGLVVQELPDEVLIYDLDRHKAHCLNPTAALVWNHCDGQMTMTEMIGILKEETHSPIDEDVVWLALDQLAKTHLLSEQVIRPTGSGKLNRRDVMRRIGWAAAVALPLVTSIVAPSAVQAVTCRAPGQPCTTGVQCCSGVCNTTTCA